MLTDLQKRVRRIISDLPEYGAFALAGGGALIASGVVRRPANDLDFFAPHPNDVTELYEAARAALEADVLKVTSSVLDPYRPVASTSALVTRSTCPPTSRTVNPNQRAKKYT